MLDRGAGMSGAHLSSWLVVLQWHGHWLHVPRQDRRDVLDFCLSVSHPIARLRNPSAKACVRRGIPKGKM